MKHQEQSVPGSPPGRGRRGQSWAGRGPGPGGVAAPATPQFESGRGFSGSNKVGESDST